MAKTARKIILACEECLARNYTTNGSKNSTKKIKKFCPKCGKMTLHKETKQKVGKAMSEELKDKKAEKQKAKEAKKLAKKNKPTRDHWFTISGISKEAKRVRWPHWTTQGSEAGTFQNTSEVLAFTIFFALFFMLCDLGVATLLRLFGIGA